MKDSVQALLVGIGPGGQALPQAGRTQKLPVSATTVLAATIIVEDQVWERAARSQGLFESIDHQGVRRWPARDQPTILREQRSMMTAR